MQFEDQSQLFQGQAVDGWTTAKKKIMSQRHLFFRPYYTDHDQRQALAYPFAHAAQCVANIVSIVYGVYLTAKSIVFAGPADALTMLVTTLHQCGNLLLNLCNLLISVLSLGSRALATIANGKYVFEPQYFEVEAIGGPISQNIKQFQIANELLNRTPEQVASEELEMSHRSLSLSLV